MAIEIKVPSVGESVTEGTLSRWFKKDGEPVRADEPLLELETEKATTEVPAPAAGTLRILVREGQKVTVGAVLGQIDEKAGASRPAGQAKPDSQAARPAPAAEKPKKKQEAVAAAPPVSEPAEKGKAEVALSPAARRLAADKGLDPRQLTAAGRGGPLTKEDVLTYLERQDASAKREAPPTPPQPEAPRDEKPPEAKRPEETAPPARETRQRMSAIRQRIAQRLVEAQSTAAILTTFNEADLSAVLDLRSRYKDAFQEKHKVGLGFMAFFVKACVEALRAFPVVNARIDGEDIVYHNYHDIGVAVSTEKGLMVPVLRDAGRLSFAEIEKRIAELAQKAREGKISVTDLQGGTFTITNGGIFGSLLSTPILNPPQSAILGMHAIKKRPVEVNDQVVIRPMMNLALSYDHRLIDGREAVRFLVRVKECVESPARMLLEV
jgi:2-oxoglutarate dehydrogenase E2 component (dihydrolipoamide succinyltransferase)